MTLLHFSSYPRPLKAVVIIIGGFVFWHYGIVYGLLGMRPEHHITNIFRQRVGPVVTYNATIVYDTGYARVPSIQTEREGSVVGRIDNAQNRKDVASKIIYKKCYSENCGSWNPFSAMSKDVPEGTKEAFKRDIMSTASMVGAGWPIHLPPPARSEASSLIDQAISAPHAQCMFDGWTDFFCLDVEGGAFVYRYRSV